MSDNCYQRHHYPYYVSICLVVIYETFHGSKIFETAEVKATQYHSAKLVRITQIFQPAHVCFQVSAAV